MFEAKHTEGPSRLPGQYRLIYLVVHTDLKLGKRDKVSSHWAMYALCRLIPFPYWHAQTELPFLLQRSIDIPYGLARRGAARFQITSLFLLRRSAGYMKRP
jgi:hypothetical protein